MAIVYIGVREQTMSFGLLETAHYSHSLQFLAFVCYSEWFATSFLWYWKFYCTQHLLFGRNDILLLSIKTHSFLSIPPTVSTLHHNINLSTMSSSSHRMTMIRNFITHIWFMRMTWTLQKCFNYWSQ